VFYRCVGKVKPSHDLPNQKPDLTLARGDSEDKMKDHKKRKYEAPSQNYPEDSEEEWETLYDRRNIGKKDHKEPRYTVNFQMC
jgi:hypothetical protein